MCFFFPRLLRYAEPRFFHSENLLITFFFHSFFAPAVLSKILSTSTAEVRIEAEFYKKEKINEELR